MTRRAGPEMLELAGDESDDAKIDRAARVLARGGLVAFPTDTVYGLGADGSRPEAVEKLYTVKGRDCAKPFARLVPDARSAVEAAPGWGRLARKLALACWPGALTIVVGGVGLRVPAHRAARALASKLSTLTGGGLLATSANRSGELDPRTAREVVEALGNDVDLVLDGGETAGVSSTVVRADGPRLEILRGGAIAEEELRLIEAEPQMEADGCQGAVAARTPGRGG